MATTDVALHEAFGQGEPKRVVNNMSIQVATVNGSGSQSSNTVLLRSIFQMGVPVSGKNLFPSNIAGLPTWYTIRANQDGYIARKKEIDFVIAMNAETAQEDVMSLAAGAASLLRHVQLARPIDGFLAVRGCRCPPHERLSCARESRHFSRR